jgi:hypothetical protein
MTIKTSAREEGRKGGMPADVAALIARAMPATTAMVRDYRRTLGDAHVTECVRRGLAGEPGYFFAREGTLAVGTAWGADPDILSLFTAQGQGCAFVMLKPLAGDGACMAVQQGQRP